MGIREEFEAGPWFNYISKYSPEEAFSAQKQEHLSCEVSNIQLDTVKQTIETTEHRSFNFGDHSSFNVTSSYSDHGKSEIRWVMKYKISRAAIKGSFWEKMITDQEPPADLNFDIPIIAQKYDWKENKYTISLSPNNSEYMGDAHKLLHYSFTDNGGIYEFNLYDFVPRFIEIIKLDIMSRLVPLHEPCNMEFTKRFESKMEDFFYSYITDKLGKYITISCGIWNNGTAYNALMEWSGQQHIKNRFNFNIM